jgi:alpha-ketoglutaric semialdehyde dehydrogenase
VYKAHPGHPVLSDMVAQIIIEAAHETDMPDGIFSLVHALKTDPAIHLVKHPLIKAVAFTGSLKAGRSIYDIAAKRDEPVPVYAEMGSTNPVFILPGIMQQKGEEIAKALAASNLLSAGQFCTNPGIIISGKNADAEKFQNSFASAITSATGEAMLTGSIFKTYDSHTKKLADTGGVTTVSKSNVVSQSSATPQMFAASVDKFIEEKDLHEEIFGPASVHITVKDKDEFMKIAASLGGQLTVTIWGNEEDISNYSELVNYLELKAGRLIINGVPTGVEVTHAMMHGGPYPATTDSKFTSVGTTAIYRFTRPVCYQNFSNEFLPAELKNENSLDIVRMLNGEYTKNKIE